MRRILIFIALSVLLAVGGLNILFTVQLPDTARNHVLSALHNAGFTGVQITPDIKKSNILIFKNINLDKEGFSTIKTIKLHHSLTGLLKHTPITDIKIDGLNLTGEGAIGGAITVAGLDTKHINPERALNQIPEITISNSNIDLFIPSLGGINLHYDMRITKNDETKDHNITGRFSGKQRQLSITGAINGHIAENGDWSLTFDIEQGKFNHPTIKATRLNGLIDFSGGPNKALQSDIQLTSGGLNIMGLPWQSANANIRRNNGHYIILAEGKSIGQAGIEFTTQLTYESDQFQSASGTIHAQKFSDILAYLNANNVKTIKLSPLTSRDSIGEIDIVLTKEQGENITYSIQNTDASFRDNGEISIKDEQAPLLKIINTLILSIMSHGR